MTRIRTVADLIRALGAFAPDTPIFLECEVQFSDQTVGDAEFELSVKNLETRIIIAKEQ